MANLNIRCIVDNFYTNPDVTIEGSGLKTWDLEGMSLSLKSDDKKYFVMLTSKKKWDWILHFENDSDKPFTDEEKFTLLEASADIMESGDIITTEGGVTPGGISCLKRYQMYGFEIIDKNSGQLVYWASPRMLDAEKWAKWIKDANPEDYKIIDKNLPISIENTRPVVPVLKKR